MYTLGFWWRFKIGRKKSKGKRGKWDLVMQHCKGYTIELNKWVAKVEWDMQDVGVVEGVA
jgi:hypothetical protein